MAKTRMRRLLISQKLKVVDTIESSDSHAFMRILQDAVPQMVSSMKQNIDTSLGNFEKILQDALQTFSKKNEQLPKQHITVSKPAIAQEKFGNASKIAPLVIDERTNPALHPGTYEQEGRGTRDKFFPGLYAKSPNPNEFFSISSSSFSIFRFIPALWD